MKKCIFAGTFDPFTSGHENTVTKCLAIFDEVVIAVATNPKKTGYFTKEERVEMIAALYNDNARVRVLAFEGAIVDLLEREDTPFYVRGVRNTVDFEYENADFFASRRLDPNLIEIYIPAEQELLHVSSSLVKNCMTFGKPYRQYVPQIIYDYIQKRDKSV